MSNQGLFHHINGSTVDALPETLQFTEDDFQNAIDELDDERIAATRFFLDPEGLREVWENQLQNEVCYVPRVIVFAVGVALYDHMRELGREPLHYMQGHASHGKLMAQEVLWKITNGEIEVK